MNTSHQVGECETFKPATVYAAYTEVSSGPAARIITLLTLRSQPISQLIN